LSGDFLEAYSTRFAVELLILRTNSLGFATPEGCDVLISKRIYSLKFCVTEMYNPLYEYRATKCHDDFVIFHFLSVITT
jgi:hypothetical protein